MPRAWMASIAAEISALRRTGSIPMRGMPPPDSEPRIAVFD
jgi:hypothetical protein